MTVDTKSYEAIQAVLLQSGLDQASEQETRKQKLAEVAFEMDRHFTRSFSIKKEKSIRDLGFDIGQVLEQAAKLAILLEQAQLPGATYFFVPKPGSRQPADLMSFVDSSLFQIENVENAEVRLGLCPALLHCEDGKNSSGKLVEWAQFESLPPQANVLAKAVAVVI